MKDLLFATAKSNTTIEVGVAKSLCNFKLNNFRFYADHEVILQLEVVSISEYTSFQIYTLTTENLNFIPGHYYEIATDQNFFIPIDISFLGLTDEFEQQYRFDGQLGAIYTPQATTFRVYSPFSCEINLHVLKKDSKQWETYSMQHDFATGVFSITIKGDYDCASYLYERLMFGKSLLVADPYAFSSASNGRWSYVIDPEKIKSISSNCECLPQFDDPAKAIIYECNVRDMTSLTSIKNKGTYLGLATKGLKDEHNNPIGIDYLASLGVTHIQLMPVMDFQTVDEDRPSSMYNWGYDPMYYFSPEGSYATMPNDPYSRVIELKQLISALHKEGLRVVLDVVYNHVYSNLFNPLNLLCPNYFFRLDNNGYYSNGSGCGNDLETRNYMVRKLVVDSLLHFVNLFDVDGYRFDLMGILDIETIKVAYEELIKLQPEILYYGEGWDLGTNLPANEKASYYNAFQMPYAAFFNDRFRDVCKGKTNETEIAVRGYLLGDTNYRDGFKHVLLGSSIPLSFAPMFASFKQSVNYVECHDNHTLYDKIKLACFDDSEEEIKHRIKMNIVAILFACGIPFFHQGMEICGTKNGLPNTYNAGDELNGFNYELLEQNKDLYNFFKDAIKLKKIFIDVSGDDYDSLIEKDRISFDNLENGALKVNYDLKDYKIYIIFNPSKETFSYEFENYVNLIFNESGILSDNTFYAKLAIINALSVSIYYETKGEKVKKLLFEETK